MAGGWRVAGGVRSRCAFLLAHRLEPPPEAHARRLPHAPRRALWGSPWPWLRSVYGKGFTVEIEGVHDLVERIEAEDFDTVGEVAEVAYTDAGEGCQ